MKKSQLRQIIKEEIQNKLNDENQGIEDKLYDILDDAYDNATNRSNYSEYTSKSDLIKFAIPKILELFN